MKKQLVRLANHLDSKGLTKEADYLDSIIEKTSGDKYESPFKIDRLSPIDIYEDKTLPVDIKLPPDRKPNKGKDLEKENLEKRLKIMENFLLEHFGEEFKSKM